MEYSWIMNNTAKFGMAAVAAVIIAFAIFAGSDSGVSKADQQAIDEAHSARQIHENEMQGCKHAADFDKCLADLSK